MFYTTNRYIRSQTALVGHVFPSPPDIRMGSGVEIDHQSFDQLIFGDLYPHSGLVSLEVQAKIADFGNLKSNTQQVSTSAHIVSNQMYTKGYLAPGEHQS